MSTNVTDLSARLAFRRRRRGDLAAATYTVLLLEDLTIEQLEQRLRGSGLSVEMRHGQHVLHQAQTPPNDAA